MKSPLYFQKIAWRESRNKPKLADYDRGLRDAFALMAAFRAYELLGFWPAVLDFAAVWLAIHVAFLLIAFVTSFGNTQMKSEP